MVLVDTSIWIRFLRNEEPFTSQLAHLLSLDVAFGHPFVYGELLIGDPGGRVQFLSNYGHLYQTKIVPHREVIEFVRRRGLHGRGVGWIDVNLLASALVDGVRLWTADSRLSALAVEVGAAFVPPA